jgi:hypothetical protein
MKLILNGAAELLLYTASSKAPNLDVGKRGYAEIIGVAKEI